MTSRKPSARAKRAAAFKADLFDAGNIFERERQHLNELDARRDQAFREKSCASKRRYSCKSDALEAIARCEDHGRRGLSCYKCSYCGGWHLTSHPW